ncbi:MAG: helix-turn-helix transcriptional regulator [Hamadaea sp.]|uniref:helix-turn-helix domain-containing protein n=1 Tax=Hamadaea sp. TaxID=2024425 RepID=UPI001847F9C6|nr:helix-turn-helix transcriptional regulator [Hamadaea sp.]NUT20580.1 helix-turn-helix transcriptional regulator [Hamadaea sp.]
MTVSSPTVGELLRHWRSHRRLSQLDLAGLAEVSARHLSFLETGRAKPSRPMLLRLAEMLDVPLRERNRLLLASGYAPAYTESEVTSPRMAGVWQAVRQVLTGHEPYPAVVTDRFWRMLDANAAIDLMTGVVAPWLLEPPANILRAGLHPEGLAPHIVNFGEWRAHLLTRLRRQAAVAGDSELMELYAELKAYPCDDPEPEVESPGSGDVVTPLRLRTPLGELTFFSTIATFGIPADVTVAELAIESFFPADQFTADVLRARQAAR